MQTWIKLLMTVASMMAVATVVSDMATPASAAAEEQTCTLAIDGMTCASCGVAVKTALKKVDGFKSAKVSVKEKQAIVTYDPSKTTPQALADAVTKIGYTATPKGAPSNLDATGGP